MTAIAIGFVLGLCWLQQQALLPEPGLRGWLLLAAALTAVLAGVLRHRPGVRFTRVPRYAFLAVLGCACAVLWGSWRAEQRLAEILL